MINSTKNQIVNCVKVLAEELKKLAVLVAADTADKAENDETINLVPMNHTSGFDVHSVPPEQTAAPAVTLADVRACLAELSRAGFTGKVRELIHSHGADKLSDIDPSEYAAVLAEAEELKNGQ